MIGFAQDRGGRFFDVERGPFMTKILIGIILLIIGIIILVFLVEFFRIYGKLILGVLLLLLSIFIFFAPFFDIFKFLGWIERIIVFLFFMLCGLGFIYKHNSKTKLFGYDWRSRRD